MTAVDPPSLAVDAQALTTVQDAANQLDEENFRYGSVHRLVAWKWQRRPGAVLKFARDQISGAPQWRARSLNIYSARRLFAGITAVLALNHLQHLSEFVRLWYLERCMMKHKRGSASPARRPRARRPTASRVADASLSRDPNRVQTHHAQLTAMQRPPSACCAQDTVRTLGPSKTRALAV
jgi:hypothetical protein